MDLTTSTILSLSGTVLTIYTEQTSDIGSHSFRLQGRLQDYATLGYFAEEATITINVGEEVIVEVIVEEVSEELVGACDSV